MKESLRLIIGILGKSMKNANSYLTFRSRMKKEYFKSHPRVQKVETCKFLARENFFLKNKQIKYDRFMNFGL